MTNARWAIDLHHEAPTSLGESAGSVVETRPGCVYYADGSIRRFEGTLWRRLPQDSVGIARAEFIEYGGAGPRGRGQALPTREDALAALLYDAAGSRVAERRV